MSRRSRAWSGRCSATSRRPFWTVPLQTCSTWPVPPVPLLVRGHADDPGTLGADRRRRRGAAGGGSGRQGLQECPHDGRRTRPSLCRGRMLPGACSTRTTATWRARWYNFEPGRRRPSSEAGQADPQGRAAVHRGRLPIGEARSSTQFAKAKHPINGLLRQVAGLRDAGEASARRGQDRLRLGRCPAVRDGPGAGRGPQGRTST